MTLVEAEPLAAPEPDGEAPAGTVGGSADAHAPTALPDDLLAPGAVDLAAADDEPRCGSCGTALVAGEDWCLTCGAAVTRPRRTPGLRALAIAGALALVLAGGAVAASYAALNDTPPPQEVKVQTFAKVTPAPAPEPVDTTPVVTDVPAPAPLDTTPTVTPITPVTPVTPVTPTTTPTATTPKPKPVPKPGTTPILVASDAGSLYDPSQRATASGIPSRALDGDPNTSWFVTTPDGADMNVGYLVDLGDPAAVLKLRLLTKTPGFSVEVFGANGKKAPATTDSTDWTRLGEAGSVDGDAPEGSAPSSPPVDGDKAGDGVLVMPLEPAAAGDTYRWVMLWVTTPPAAGATVRFNEIRLFR